MEHALNIKAFVFDVDGVLTDGGIYAIDGDLLRKFDSKDGFGVRMASMKGYALGIITGGISPTIVQRADRLGIPRENVYLRSRDKMADLRDFCEKNNVTFEEILYCGDDVPDIGPIKACGIGACPADAVDEVKEIADYISPREGGKQFVRNVIEQVMREQGTWELSVEQYKDKF